MPLTTDIDPPVLFSEAPALKLSWPPEPERLAPTLSETDPDLAALDAPVDMRMLPVEPSGLVPVFTPIDPLPISPSDELSPFVPAVARLRSPERPAAAEPLARLILPPSSALSPDTDPALITTEPVERPVLSPVCSRIVPESTASPAASPVFMFNVPDDPDVAVPVVTLMSPLFPPSDELAD
jgi:hypothetical protein